MLVQVVALLSLGVLCSSAPLQATRSTTPGRHPQSEERSRTLVELNIRELLEDMQNLHLSADTRVVTVNAKMERCMHSHLKTFADTLEALKTQSTIASKLTIIKNHENILPKDLDEECKTVQVTRDVFLETLNTFLRLLFEKIQTD